jgi:hypothetical protein
MKFVAEEVGGKKGKGKKGSKKGSKKEASKVLKYDRGRTSHPCNPFDSTDLRQ